MITGRVRFPILSRWIALRIVPCGTIWVTLCAAGELCAAVETVHADGDDRRAMSAIFGSALHTDLLTLRERTRSLAAEERYRQLLEIVLPSYDRNEIRIGIDFSPTHPIPTVAERLRLADDVRPVDWHLGIPSADTRDSPELVSKPSTGTLPDGMPVRQQVGGTLISSALDLVSTARELGRLDELRAGIDAREPLTDPQRRGKFALTALVAIAAAEFETASEQLTHIYELAANVDVLDAERGPEAVAIALGLQFPQTRDAARELALLVYEQARNNLGPRSERWHRQMYSYKHRLELINTTSATELTSKRSAGPLRQWNRVSRETAETRGKGFPLSRWERVDGSISHLGCHDHDYLYYASPLTGDFAIEAETTTFNYREIQLAVGGLWAGPGYDLKACLNGDFRSDFDSLPIDPQLTRMFERMNVRVVVRNGACTTSINGRNVLTRPHPADADPWLALHSLWYTSGAVHDLRITGDPVVPAVINLAVRSDLPGWLPYFDESAGSIDSDWRLEQKLDFSLKPRRATPLSDSPIVAPPMLVGRSRPEQRGQHVESLLRYHRPMLEDGTIEYEFLYRPGETAVHPVLDRMCFFLDPAGVTVHWITDGRFERMAIDPGNQSVGNQSIGDQSIQPDNRRGPPRLPLIVDAWNRLQLRLDGDIVRILLNNQPVCQRTLESTNQRTFGLFHFADRTEARVRRIQWRGDWPRVLRRPADQELSDDSVEQLVETSSRLPVVFEHDFSNGLPFDRIGMMESTWQDDFDQLPHGVRFRRPGATGYHRYTIAPQLTIGGDFEITVAFEGFQAVDVDAGNANIQLYVGLEGETQTECRVYRRFEQFQGRPDEQLAQAAIFRMRGGIRQFDFPESPAQESTAGRMRLVRIGSRMHFLYAENDSPVFRRIHSEDVDTNDTRENEIRLVVETQEPGLTSVVWKHVVIRAETASGPATIPSLTLAELDAAREQLPAHVAFDFTDRSESSGGFLQWGRPRSTLQFGPDGLTLTVPGAEQWESAGVAPDLSIHGDFDMSLDLDVLHMERAGTNHESAIMIQAEFLDPRRTVVETKFAITPDGRREAEAMVRRLGVKGNLDYTEFNRLRAGTATRLRIARRGRIAYLIFQESSIDSAKIIGRVDVGELPVPANLLRVQVHTGGSNRETRARFKSLGIHAARLTGVRSGR